MEALVQTILEHYHQEGRHDLPWRINRTPYTAFISEIMLQQTQVDRVIPKFTAFIKALPTFEELANAPQSAALTLWSGLGYNRRALNLQRAARMVVEDFKGILPSTYEELQQLPGIGPATAGSLQVYAYNKSVPFIETNVRAVFIYHFFAHSSNVTDKELLPLIEETLIYVQDPYDWYSALMDYGTKLKKKHKNPARKSKHHQKQSKFEGSNRQVRGAILKLLATHPTASILELQSIIKDPKHRVEATTIKLVHEGFLSEKDGVYQLAS